MYKICIHIVPGLSGCCNEAWHAHSKIMHATNILFCLSHLRCSYQHNRKLLEICQTVHSAKEAEDLQRFARATLYLHVAVMVWERLAWREIRKIVE